MALVKTIEMSIVADPGDARGVLGDLTAQGDELRKPITMVLTADSAEAQEQVDTLAEAEERAAAATDAVVDAQARLAEVQADGAATADDLAAAQERVEDALVRNIATQDELTAAQLRNADAARVEGDAQEELAVKEDTAGDAAAGAGEKFKLGSMAMLGVVAAIAGIGYESVKMAVNFQSSMETLVTQAGVPKSALAGLKTGVLALAGQVGDTPDSLAQALYHVESSFPSVGISGPEGAEPAEDRRRGRRGRPREPGRRHQRPGRDDRRPGSPGSSQLLAGDGRAERDRRLGRHDDAEPGRRAWAPA